METLHSETSKQRGHATSPGPLMQRRLDPSTRRRGYILIMFTLSLSFLLGVIGLAVDIGRMYVVKSETQSFVDAAALNAAVQLVLNPGAFTTATNAAAQTPKKWEFGTNAFTGVVTKFGRNPDDTFIASPPDSLKETYTFAQVTARVNLPLYLLPVVVGATRSSIAAMAIAGQQATTALAGGELPFSPFSRKNFSPKDILDDPNDPFGYKISNTYTLRWGAPGTRSTCDNGLDELSEVAVQGDFRGYCCVGGNSVGNLAREIALGGGTVPVNVGDPFVPLIASGQMAVIQDAIAPYIGYDTDTTSTTYAQYKAAGNGNGKRLIIVPVNGLVNGVATVVGFAGFFLLPATNYPKTPSSASWCAEYVGRQVQGVPLAPGAGFGVYHMKIYR